MKRSAVAFSLGALGVLGFAGSAWAAVTPGSGSLAVVANVGIGVTNPDITAIVLSSNTASDSQSWTSVPANLAVSASTSTSYLGDTVSAQGSAVASWASATSGSMTFSNYGWTFNVNNPLNTYSEADLVAGRPGSDWAYTFTTSSNATFSMTYDVTASGDTFGLWGWPVNGVSGTGAPVVNAYDPTTSGTFVANLTPGTYTVSLDSFPNVGAGGSSASGQMSGQFNWLITTAGVPEPATWAMMLVGIGGLGGAMRSQRRRQALTAA
jgi:hypothetical protein